MSDREKKYRASCDPYQPFVTLQEVVKEIREGRVVKTYIVIKDGDEQHGYNILTDGDGKWVTYEGFYDGKDDAPAQELLDALNKNDPMSDYEKQQAILVHWTQRDEGFNDRIGKPCDERGNEINPYGDRAWSHVIDTSDGDKIKSIDQFVKDHQLGRVT